MTAPRSRSAIFGALALMAIGALTACSPETGCEDPKAVDQVVKLTKNTAARDLAYQCERVLYEKIPDLKLQCSGESAHSDACMQACKSWASAVVEAKVDQVVQSFRDKTVALYSCKAKVHYAIDFDGGQTVEGDVRYYVKPALAGPQVELAK